METKGMKNLRRLIYLKFARRLSRNSQSIPVPSIISNNSSFEGNIESSGIIHIDGRYKGNINCEELIIGALDILSTKDGQSYKYFDLTNIGLFIGHFQPCEGNVFEVFCEDMGMDQHFFFG